MVNSKAYFRSKIAQATGDTELSDAIHNVRIDGDQLTLELRDKGKDRRFRFEKIDDEWEFGGEVILD